MDDGTFASGVAVSEADVSHFRSVVIRLAGCAWIRGHEVVPITGAVGTGAS